jgi:hypothetical protein
MTEGWAIAIAGFVVTIALGFLGLGIKALWDIAKAFRELVTKQECHNAMGEHCKDIALLQKGFEENKSALRQIIMAIKEKHGLDIKYEG